MSLDLYMLKQFGALRPMGPLDAEQLDELPNGCEVRVSITRPRPRSLKMHRLFFAALALIFKNQDRYQTLDQLLSAVKVELGYVEWFKMRDGREIGIPQSIAFNHMDQTQFNEFFNRFCDLVQAKIIPGLKKAELTRELREMIGTAALQKHAG